MAGEEKTGYWLFKQEPECYSYAEIEEPNPEQHGLKFGRAYDASTVMRSQIQNNTD